MLEHTKLRHFWPQIVSWAPRHARKTFIVLGPGVVAGSHISNITDTISKFVHITHACMDSKKVIMWSHTESDANILIGIKLDYGDL